MKQYFIIVLVVIAMLFLAALEIGYGKTMATTYPFSESIDWEKEDTRQRYEIFLQIANIHYATLPIFRPEGEARIAKEESCVFFEKNGGLIGYGIAFNNLTRFAHAKKKDDLRKISVQKAEVIYDLADRRIFLVSYSFELNAAERFVAKYIMGRQTEFVRQNFKDGVLDEGYELDGESKKLVEQLLAFPQECKKAFDETRL